MQPHDRQRGGRRIFEHVKENAGVGQTFGAQTHNKLLIKDVGHQRSHGPGNDAHGDNRHGQRRQDQKLQMIPVPGPVPRTGGTGTGAGQPPQLRRKHDHHHHAQPVVRHADAHDRQHGGQAVYPGVAEITGHKTEQATQHKTDDGGYHCKPQRVAHRGQHFGRHGPVAGNRNPQIAVQRAPDPQRKLFGQ